MPQFFMNKRLMLLLVCVIVLVAMIGFSVKSGRGASWPEKLVGDTTGFFQGVFHKPSQFIAGMYGNVQDLKNTYDENERLRKKLDGQTQYEAKLQELEDENKKLRKQLGYVNSIRDYTPILSTVIARNPSLWDSFVMIDKGKKQGVDKDMAVTNESGALIGKIESDKLNNFTSTVRLLSSTDQNNRISTKIFAKKGKEELNGIINGYDSKKKMLTMNILKSDADGDVKKGDLVETSGAGGVFPQGLTIGKVSEIEPDHYGLTKIIYVEPAAELNNLDRVIVVNRSTSTADASELTKEEGS
ncbi:rod shape-determining protein MreC [Bacillus sp. A015]|uniref:Cell shape-determining protein MreC n=1 Tax=Bacillus pumilus TaxID=1408 RepID=A0A2G8ISS6_BACPU|nr:MULTISPECIES: rod shape-determining protein MreC [Bacillus]MCC9088080.1 rod shape-determining protein MreC [Bacillus pumilus]PIK26586.1 rod shape-determining protein MreC [Bacillus pumilus]UUD41620.1 rod shape-determining protein MreC [Bacillus pumilus]